jgi:UTP--glucose-1-phosphate uridylyltransferase
MHLTKAVITLAGRNQRTLPLQTLIDRDGEEKAILTILLDEVHRAGVDEICLVVRPGDEEPYGAILGRRTAHVHFVHQNEPQGHGHAVYCARDFVGDDPFLHLVGDHLYVSRETRGCAEQLVALAQREQCAISAVQATRETLLPYYGAIGGRRVQGQPGLYEVETVIEKPTPTVAEQRLIVSGLRAGHYLCFFGMHVLTKTMMELLGEQIAAAQAAGGTVNVTLSQALALLPQRERYLASEQHYSRYDVGVKYGLLNAQLALALNGADREQVLTMLLALLAERELMAKGG